jgi:peptidoglycan/xylan/chitin deacetylase (PgdA/CDA1 family)
MHNVLILNYHSLDVGKHSAEYHVDPVYSVTQSDFEAQMALIKELKIPVVSLAEVVSHIHKRQRWHRHVVCITFDDGFVTDYEVAYPVLKKYNFPATFFITIQNQKSPERWVQWREMAAAGFTLGSHTVSHPYLSLLPEADMRRELTESKQIIEKETGAEVTFLAPPYGRYNRKLIQLSQETGYAALLTTNVGVNRYNANVFELKRWTVRRKTSLKAFRRMILRNPREMRLKQMRSRSLNFGKKVLGNGFFEKIRNFILRPKS